MPKYVIERNVPGVGSLAASDIKAMCVKSLEAMKSLGPEVHWLHSYLTDDKIYCVYNAKNREIVLEHAKRGGFPADRVAEVKTVMDWTTTE
jgi:hypothetical protein